MARSRRKSEAPRLRIVQGGAHAVVKPSPAPRPSAISGLRPSVPASIRSEPERDPEAPAPEADERGVEEPTASRPRDGRRAWVAALAIAATLLLAYLALRRR